MLSYQFTAMSVGWTRLTSRGPLQPELFCVFNFAPQIPFNEIKHSELLISSFVLHLLIFVCTEHGM